MKPRYDKLFASLNLFFFKINIYRRVVDDSAGDE